MNIDLKICQIKNIVRNNNISLEYFINCFILLNYLIKTEDYKGALSFAKVLKEASIFINSRIEQIEYFRCFNKINEIIADLEKKLTKVR